MKPVGPAETSVNKLCSVQFLKSVVNKNCICMKVCFKMGKTAKETYSMLQVAFGSETLTFFEWYRYVKSGCESWVEAHCSGCPFMC
jgi:hypothetical protein